MGVISLRNTQKQIRSQSATQSTRSEAHCLTIPKTRSVKQTTVIFAVVIYRVNGANKNLPL